MSAIFCPSCGAKQPTEDSNRRDYRRCHRKDCGVPFIEDPQVEVLDDAVLRAASTLASRGD